MVAQEVAERGTVVPSPSPGRPPPRPKLTPAELREADALALAHRMPYQDRPPESDRETQNNA